MDSTTLEKYFNENERLLNTEDFYDVKICVGVEPNIEEFHAHASIICAHCPFFSIALNNATKENGYYIVKTANINEQLFKHILKFLYTCKIELDSFTGVGVLEILVAADELGLESLYEYTMNYFIKEHEDYIKENPVKILQLIYSNEKFKELKKNYLKKICDYSEKLFQSNEFELLEKPILLEILKRDDFSVNEIVIWENVLKWGLSRHPEINNNDLKNWSPQNFVDLGNTIKEFIPLIRFQDISKDDFFNKIVPYWKLLTEFFWDDLLQYYLVPDRQHSLNLLPSRNIKLLPNLESMTINRKLTLLFASWIDGKSPPYNSHREVKYEFKLLYCSSRDGLDSTVFHEKCDNINKTLVIGKIQNSDQIIGGYNPLNWGGSGYKTTTESFIFNISDRNNIDTAQFSYVKNVKNINNNVYAIYCDPTHFPIFGYGWDIYFYIDGNFCHISSYPYSYNNISIANNSKFDELKVFQVIDKK